MSHRVRFTRPAEADLLRLYAFLLEREPSDWDLAERALDSIRHAIVGLGFSPFSYRKTTPGNAFLRELVIPFGSAGYAILFEIDDADTVTVLAVRHQREDDYH